MIQWMGERKRKNIPVADLVEDWGGVEDAADIGSKEEGLKSGSDVFKSRHIRGRTETAQGRAWRRGTSP